MQSLYINAGYLALWSAGVSYLHLYAKEPIAERQQCIDVFDPIVLLHASGMFISIVLFSTEFSIRYCFQIADEKVLMPFINCLKPVHAIALSLLTIGSMQPLLAWNRAEFVCHATTIQQCVMPLWVTVMAPLSGMLLPSRPSLAIQSSWIISFVMLFIQLILDRSIYTVVFVLISSAVGVLLTRFGYISWSGSISDDLLPASSRLLVRTPSHFDREIMQAQKKRSQIIANMAHDIRTPLQSMCAGLITQRSCMTKMFHFIQTLVGTDSNTPAKSFDHDALNVVNSILQECFDSIDDLDVSFNFMSMQINRAVDVAKYENSIDLSPHLEGINIIHTLDKVIHCANVLYGSKVSLVLEELPEVLRRFPVLDTDRLWLNENLLCVVSNAMKFASSTNPEVAVRVKLCEVVDGLQSRPGTAVEHDMYYSSEKGAYTVEIPSHSDCFKDGSSERCYVLFEVEDNGETVLDSNKSHKMFFPVDQSECTTGGTGMGLMSLQLRVRELGGICGVRSKGMGQPGACVYFAVPYIPHKVEANKSPDVMSDSSTSNEFPTSEDETCYYGRIPGLDEYKTLESWEEDSRVQKEQRLAEPIPSPPAVCSGSRYDASSPMPVPVASPDGKIKDADLWAPPVHLADTPDFPTCGTPPNPEENDMHDVTHSIPPHRPLEILFVDDSAVTLKITAKALRSFGCVVDTARDGKEALAKITQRGAHNRYDVVLTDIQMPVMNGKEAVRLLRQMEAQEALDKGVPLPQQVVIGTSSNTDSETRQKAISSGMNFFLPKPFTTQEFLQFVANHVPPSCFDQR